MAVRLYNEYIKVDPNFIPVFSRNSDKTYFFGKRGISLPDAIKESFCFRTL